jgi:hypothetical protein
VTRVALESLHCRHALGYAGHQAAPTVGAPVQPGQACMHAVLLSCHGTPCPPPNCPGAVGGQTLHCCWRTVLLAATRKLERAGEIPPHRVTLAAQGCMAHAYTHPSSSQWRGGAMCSTWSWTCSSTEQPGGECGVADEAS